MRTFVPTFLTAIAFLAPSLALAQTPPPPATSGSHPIAVPPTKAPDKTLPPALLPNGQMTLSATSSAGASATTSAEQAENESAAADNTMLFTLIGVGVLVLAGIGWFLIPRKNTEPTQGGMTGM